MKICSHPVMHVLAPTAAQPFGSNRCQERLAAGVAADGAQMQQLCSLPLLGGRLPGQPSHMDPEILQKGRRKQKRIAGDSLARLHQGWHIEFLPGCCILPAAPVRAPACSTALHVL